MIKFHDRLFALRQKKMVTQAEVADYLGVTPKAISFYETGNREASFDTLMKLSKFFNVSVDYLLGCENEEIHLTVDEEKLIDIYRYLNDERKDALLSTATNLKRGMILENEEIYTKVVADNGEVTFVKMKREKAKEIKSLFNTD